MERCQAEVEAGLYPDHPKLVKLKEILVSEKDDVNRTSGPRSFFKVDCIYEHILMSTGVGSDKEFSGNRWRGKFLEEICQYHRDSTFCPTEFSCIHVSFSVNMPQN